MVLIWTQLNFCPVIFNSSRTVQYDRILFHLLCSCFNYENTLIWNSSTSSLKPSPKLPTLIFTCSHLQNSMHFKLKFYTSSLHFLNFSGKNMYFQAGFLLFWPYNICSHLIQSLNSETIKSLEKLWNQQSDKQDPMSVLTKKSMSACIHTLLDSKKSNGKAINKCPKVKEKFESQLALRQTQDQGTTKHSRKLRFTNSSSRYYLFTKEKLKK